MTVIRLMIASPQRHMHSGSLTWHCRAMSARHCQSLLCRMREVFPKNETAPMTFGILGYQRSLGSGRSLDMDYSNVIFNVLTFFFFFSSML